MPMAAPLPFETEIHALEEILTRLEQGEAPQALGVQDSGHLDIEGVTRRWSAGRVDLQVLRTSVDVRAELSEQARVIHFDVLVVIAMHRRYFRRRHAEAECPARCRSCSSRSHSSNRPASAYGGGGISAAVSSGTGPTQNPVTSCDGDNTTRRTTVSAVKSPYSSTARSESASGVARSWSRPRRTVSGPRNGFVARTIAKRS